uniref:Uncharacterized protein n=1 Tax=Haptolina brevifila TaxID=156173 RepID=A0A7S2N9H6_9EUKA
MDQKWLARPFVTAVVKPVVLKLNKRADVEPVSAEVLERLEIDGEEVALPDASASAASVVPASASQVQLFFGSAPPAELKFVVHSGSVEFTITLDAKFMRKSFLDAVVKPFVTMYSKRAASAVSLDELVEVHVDGVKPYRTSCRTETQKPAFIFLGRYPSHVELFFSWEDVTRAAKKHKPHSSLRFKVYVPPPAELQQKEAVLTFDHQELNSADGEELASKLIEAAKNTTLQKLKHIYLEHNDLRDDGVAALARALTNKATPALRKLQLGHNRVTNEGARALAESMNPSPNMDQIFLNNNWIGEAGAIALEAAIGEGTLTVKELFIHSNPGIIPSTRQRLKKMRECVWVLDVSEAGDQTSPFNDNAPTQSRFN